MMKQVRAMLFACPLVLSLSPLSALAADLEVRVENVTSDEGQVMVGVFDGAEQFPNKQLSGQSMRADRRADGKVLVRFTGLAPGRYAVSAYHDRNGNQQLDRNVMGVPKEPYGFSNGARGSFGPPSFQDAAVELPAGGTAIVVNVQ